MTYDDNGNLRRLQLDYGFDLHFDAWGRVIYQMHPDGSNETWVYPRGKGDCLEHSKFNFKGNLTYKYKKTPDGSIV